MLAPPSYKHITVRPASGAVGGIVEGLDLKRLLADPSPSAAEVRAELRKVWLDHGVIFFRNQPLSSEEFLKLAAVFNPPIEYPFVSGIPGYPQIIEVKKLPNETRAFGNVWHSDTSYLDEPPSATLLTARELPPRGLGDTIFANQNKAFEALSPKMREILVQLTAVNSSAKADVTKTREDRINEQATGTPAPPKKDYNAFHPAVTTHPETGKKVLFVNFAHTARFDGMTEEESAPLLNFLFQHQIKPEFTFRWSWEGPGDIAIWDNRTVQHYPVNDYHGYKRWVFR